MKFFFHCINVLKEKKKKNRDSVVNSLSTNEPIRTTNNASINFKKKRKKNRFRRKSREEFYSSRSAVSTARYNQRFAANKSNLFSRMYLYVALRNVIFSLFISPRHGARVARISSQLLRARGFAAYGCRIDIRERIPRGRKSINALLLNKTAGSLSATVVGFHLKSINCRFRSRSFQFVSN